MQSQRITLTLALAAVLGSAGAAQAQIGVYNRPQINPRPTVSPYLNILRGNPAINYFGTVRPQIEMNQQLFQLQQQVQQYQGQPNLILPLDPQQQQGALATFTGHSATWQNYSHYYTNRLATGGVAGGSGNPTGQPVLGITPNRPIIPTPVVQ